MHKQTEAYAAKALDMIAARLDEARAANDQTYADVATRAGYDPSSLRRWLKARSDQLTVIAILRIARAVNLDGAALLGEAFS